MKLLFVNSCPRGETSRTLLLARTFLSAVREACPEAEIIEHDLPSMGLMPYTAEMLAQRELLCDAQSWQSPLTAPAVQLQQADAVIVAAPYWDLSFPAMLKVWVEHMWVRNLTFVYRNDLPVGLCRGRESVYITTSGSPIGENDWGAMYMKAVLTTLGIPGFSSIRAEGLDLDAADPEALLAGAQERARRAAAAFVHRLSANG